MSGFKRIKKYGCKLLLFSFLQLTVLQLGAQSYIDNKNDEGYFTFRLGGGLTFSQGDIKPMRVSHAFQFGTSYSLLSYLDLNLGIQKGTIKAGSGVIEPPEPEYYNHYFTASVNLHFFPLSLVEKTDRDNILSVLSRLYLGTGVGYIHSDVVSRVNVDPDWGSMGKYNGGDLYVPLDVGFSQPIINMRHNRQVLLYANYCLHLCFSDEIDGYVPRVNANKWRDAFSVISVGIGFRL